MSQDTLLSASTSAGPPVGETSLTSSSSTMTSVKYDPLVLGPVDLTHVEHISSDLSSSSIPTASIASSSSPSLRPRPPPLPPRPSSNRPISTRTQSSRSGPIGLITEPIGGFHEDFWDSANLAARDRILLEEAHRKNIAKELELERQRIVPGLNNADLLALVKSFDKVSFHSDAPKYKNMADQVASAQCAHLPRAVRWGYPTWTRPPTGGGRGVHSRQDAELFGESVFVDRHKVDTVRDGGSTDTSMGRRRNEDIGSAECTSPTSQVMSCVG